MRPFGPRTVRKDLMRRQRQLRWRQRRGSVGVKGRANFVGETSEFVGALLGLATSFSQPSRMVVSE